VFDPEAAHATVLPGAADVENFPERLALRGAVNRSLKLSRIGTAREEGTVSEPPEARGAVDIGDATWQSEQAAHDTRVAFDCNTLGDLDRAHAHAITARTAVDAV
jgi:hypothetical protein